MATKNIVPRANNEGQLGTETKKWNKQIATTGSFDYISGSLRTEDVQGALPSNLVSGSSQLASYISGSFTSVSSSLSTRVTNVESELENTLVSASAQLADQISGSFTSPSSSFSTRITTLEALDTDDDLTIAGDSGGNLTIDLDSETLTLAGGGGLSSVGSGNTITFSLDSDILSSSAQISSQISGSFNKGFEFEGTISGSATSTGSFGRIEATSISASLVEVDADTLRVGGEPMNKTLLQNIKRAHSSTVVSPVGKHKLSGDISGSISSTGSFGHLLIKGEKTSGTNTGDISLAGGSKDYVTLSNQELTINQVDLTDDVTGVLPSANLDADTAHLSGTQTFSGAKTFSSALTTAAINSSGDITTTGNITAQNFIVSSSVTNLQIATLSGSTEFGDDITDTHLFTGSLFISGNLDAVNLTADSSSFSTRTTTLEAASSSFSSRITTAESELSNTLISGSAQIATYVSGAFTDTSSSLATRATNLETDSGSFSTRLTTEEGNVDTLQARRVIAGDGLTGGGDLTADRTFAVGAGTGVTVNSGDVAIGQDIGTTSKPLFAAVSSSGDISGSATSTGSFGAVVTPTYGRTISNITEIIEVTVVDDGGNHYAFEGATTPNLVVSEGKTYRFDQSDSTNDGHPFRFSLIEDGDHNGGSAYTTGVTAVGTPGTTGAYTEIKVTKDTANRLFYYCTSHPGMGNQGNILKNDLGNFGGNISGSATSTGSFGSLSLGESSHIYTLSIKGHSEGSTGIRVRHPSDDTLFEVKASEDDGRLRLFANNSRKIQLHANDVSYFNGGNIGIGLESPDGTLHVHTATAGSVTANANADDLVVENSDHGGISILTPDDKIGYLIFGDVSDSARAGFQYYHAGVDSNERLLFNVSGGEKARLTDAGDFVLSSGDVSGSATSTGSFGHIMVGGNNFTTAVSQSAAASGFGTGGGAGGGDMNDLVDDTSPQLGGDLDLNSNDITGTGNITIDGNISGSSTSTGSFERVHITDRLGIGTTTPFNNLHILTSADNIAKFKSTDANARIILEDNNSENNGNYIQVTNDVMTLATNGGNAGLIIDDSQNIQIGGAISGSSTSTGSFGRLETAGASNIGGILSIPGFPNVSSSLAAAVAGGDNLGNHTATQDINLDGNNLTNVSSLTATSNISSSLTSTGSFGHGFIGGKLGINTTAPLDRFHVVGVVRAQDGSSGNDYVKMFHDGTDGQFTSNRGKLKLEAQSSAHMVELVSAGISGSLTSTGSFGHVMIGGDNFITAVSESAAASGFGGGGGGGSQNVFSTVAVDGQSNVVADATTDTLTLVAGDNMTITTDASGDSVTFASSGGSGGGSGASTSRSVTRAVATSGQTTFNVNYTASLLDVYQNGIKLDSTEVTATNGTSVVLSSGATVNDVLEFVAFETISTGTHLNITPDTATTSSLFPMFTSDPDFTSGNLVSASINTDDLSFTPSTGKLYVDGGVSGSANSTASFGQILLGGEEVSAGGSGGGIIAAQDGYSDTTSGTLTYTLTTSYVAFNSDYYRLTFDAPASGKVLLHAQIHIDFYYTSRRVYFKWALQGSSPSTTYADYNTYSDGEYDDKTVHPERIITGLTPGQSYTYDLFARISSTGAYLEWGGDECAPLAYVLTLP